MQLPITAAAHSAIALNAVRPYANTMGGDLRPMTGRLLTGPLTLAASAVAGVASRVGQVAGLFPDPLANRPRVGQVGFDFNSVPGLGGGGFGGPPVDNSNVPTTPRLNAALAMLQSANVMVANAQAAADAANQKVATETDPSAMGDDIAAQMQAITDLTNAQGVLAAAVQEAQAAQAEANAMAAANKPKPQAGPAPPPAPVAPPAVVPAPVAAAKSSHLLEWLLGGAVVAAGGYYIAEQM